MIKNFEALRFWAAIFVILAHLPAMGYYSILKPFAGTNLFLGSIGVDIFFVLSGYVMRLSSDRIQEVSKIQGILNFIIARIFKIYPTYLAVLTLYIILSITFESHQYEKWDIIESYLLIPIRNLQSPEDPIVTIAWTLQYEIYFYIIVAISLFFNLKIRHYFVLFSIVFSTFLNYLYGFYAGQNIVLTFLMGYFGKELARNIPAMSRANAYAILAILIAFLLFASLGRDFAPEVIASNLKPSRMQIYYGYNSIARVLAWGIPATLLVIFSAKIDSEITLPGTSWGRYSYSLYLSQALAIPFINRSSNFTPDFLLILHVGLTLAVATTLLYFFIERPSDRLKKRVRILLRSDEKITNENSSAD